jgi:hypothetical protein
MTIAQIAVTGRAVVPVSPVAGLVRSQGVWARAWDWLIDTQTRRAASVIQAHPEWSAGGSATCETAGPQL